MTRAPAILCALLAALILSYGLLAAAGARLEKNPPAPAGALGLPSRWVLEGVHVRVYEGNHRTMDARASLLEVRPARAGIFTIPSLREVRLRDVDAQIVNAQGASTRLRADRAKLNAFRRAWLLEGHARVETPQQRLACSKVSWDPVAGPLPSARCTPLPALPPEADR